MAPTPLPATDAKAGDLWSSFDDQTGRLDIANGRSAALIEIADNCEVEAERLLAVLKPKRAWWQLF